MCSRRSINRQAAHLRREADGSVTLEAALVFPVILLCTFLLLFFALYVGRQAIVYYSASIAGERAAFDWSNSARALVSGAYAEGAHDGLYWRLTDDALLAGLFGSAEDDGEEASGAKQGEVTFGGAGDGETAGDSLTERKLSPAAASLSGSLTGEMSYENRALERRIWTEAVGVGVPEPLLKLRPESRLAARTSAVVVEPAEWIRSFDLVRYYTAKLKNGKEDETDFRSKARAALERRSGQAG